MDDSPEFQEMERRWDEYVDVRKQCLLAAQTHEAIANKVEVERANRHADGRNLLAMSYNGYMRKLEYLNEREYLYTVAAHDLMLSVLGNMKGSN